jgi:hypothetical protein
LTPFLGYCNPVRDLGICSNLDGGDGTNEEKGCGKER